MLEAWTPTLATLDVFNRSLKILNVLKGAQTFAPMTSRIGEAPQS